jgi:hypothetical protein
MVSSAFLLRRFSTLVHKFGNVFCYATAATAEGRKIELLHEGREIVFRESPFERGRDAFVIALEPQQPLLDLGERAEIVRCQCLALNNREVNFDLVEPTGVNGTVNGDDVGKQGVESLDAGGASMRGARCRESRRRVGPRGTGTGS